MKKEQKRENLIDEDFDLGRFLEVASFKKVYVNGLNLHEIKIENILDYTGDFELIGLMVAGPVKRKTNITFEMDDFGSFIFAIEKDYDSEDVTFSGYV